MAIYNYTYVINAIETDTNAPNGPYVKVTFSSAGLPDIPFQFFPPNLTEAEFVTFIENDLADQAVNTWKGWEETQVAQNQALQDLQNSQLTGSLVGQTNSSSKELLDPVISDVPSGVSMRQARLALKQQGLLATVQSNIDALSEESQIEWEYAAVVERSSPLVASLGGALGLTEVQLDDLFKLAATL